MVSGSLSNFSSAVNKTGGSINALYELIEKSQDFLMRNVHSLDSILDDFDIAKFGILHAAVIHVKYISQSVVDKEWLIIQTQNFFNLCCPESLQKMPSYVRIISHEFTNCLINMGVPHKGISCMITAIRKFQKCLGQLTPLHCDLCQLALAAKMFSPTFSVLDTDILEIEQNGTALEAKDYLLYFYYGGMIYGAVKNWERSLHFLELCLIIPAVSSSCILIEAAKKIILISLILHGKFSTVPETPVAYFMSPRPWKCYCQPYLELATAFRSNNPDDLISFVDLHRELFTADFNFGLVKQVLKCHVKFRIQSLTKTFITLSLIDVAMHIKLSGTQEAEKHIVDMIKSKAIFANIDQESGTVHFLDDPEQYDSIKMLQILQQKITECVNLEKHFMQLTDRLMTNPNYAKRMIELETKTAKSVGQY
ncbi:hypothetical protein MN116_001522 [Schistosoma mekongi]|uniref:COP9 signalosome complex subunit 3 n=1 Tax=Schistosoma mekongi TaxID=38744 RepID=A0AAE1ZJ77_SCHME|nr:hypothetical protein MN116_001522 [Schistosoma mekongi]